MKQVCLLTGRPGTGKTSLIKQIVTRMVGNAGGFYTEEILNQGVREGFRLITLDGKEAILAHVSFHSPFRVSKYAVDVNALDHIGVPALRKATQECDLVVVDEIGKMELFSDSFRDAVLWIIDSGKRVIGTVMFNHNPWTDAIKRHPRVSLINLTRGNYQQVLKELSHWLGIPEYL